MALTSDVRARPGDVVGLYAAALDLQTFSGPVGPHRLHALLERAGVDPRWLTGPCWEAVQELWHRQASAAEARDALARIAP